MSTREHEFRRQIQATFRVEAQEHLQTIGAGLVDLEKAGSPAEQLRIIDAVFRAAHSLKGAARAVNFIEIESTCQSLEDAFSSWKRRKNAPSPMALDRAHSALNSIAASLAAPAISPETATARPAADAGPDGAAANGPPAAVSGQSEKHAHEETVRIAVAKLDAQLLEVEEMLTAKLLNGQRAGELRGLARQLETWRKEWFAAETHAHALRQALDRTTPGAGKANPQPAAPVAALLDFLDWNFEYLKSVESRVAALAHAAEQDYYTVGRLVDDLLKDSKKLLMLPFGTVAALFPKLVRDLCRDQGKEADLAIHGEDIEIDKRILEEMKDPLIHLLRNCIDHGIEPPERRAERGKPRRAAITLTVSQLNGNKVELVVRDDGAGIDVDRIKEAAVKRGVLSGETARQLGESEALALIFQAEVSSSPIITQLSGRGLGLAIAREKAEKLGGTISADSRRDAGTVVRITLPVALATFRGILVETAGRPFVVPTTQVERVVRVKAESILTVEGRETISLDGRALALARLDDTLELAPAAQGGEAPHAVPVIVLGAGDQRIAFVVDSVLDEHEVLVKRLEAPLVRVRNIAGATVLGSGQVAPILNVADLLKSARKTAGAARRAAPDAKPAQPESKSILVVEDSITSRMLLKNILESAGYHVKTAIDGADAIAALRSGRFDLVVSDVEMPRMNGFDLTARIRADPKLAGLPVVLVTALESREDRERGIEVGADAYLVKSRFDQSNLLETARRLI